jgi:hypothetical protein
MKLLLAYKYFNINISCKKSVKISAFYSFITATVFQIFSEDGPYRVFRMMFANVEVTYREHKADFEIKAFL